MPSKLSGVYQECRRGKPSRCAGGRNGDCPDHGWAVRVTTGKDPLTGKPVRSYETFDTLAEAESHAVDLRRAGISNGRVHPNITVGKYIPIYLHRRQTQGDDLAPGTLAGYRSALKMLAGTSLANEQVRKVRKSDVNWVLEALAQPRISQEDEDAIAEWQLDNAHVLRNHSSHRAAAQVALGLRPPGRNGRWVDQVSVGTLVSYQRAWRIFFEHSKDDDLRPYGDNPAKGTMAAIGKARATKGDAQAVLDVHISQRRRLGAWEPSQTAAFLRRIETHSLKAIFRIYAYNAPRRSEVLGISWNSYDYNYIAIEARLLSATGPQDCFICKGQHTAMQWRAGTKSHNGERDLFLPTQAVEAVQEHKARQEAHKAAMGADYVDHNLMFAEPDGNPIHPDKISREFRKIVDELGLPRIPLHGLRHNAASLLLTFLEPHIVAKLTGHDIKTLTKFYQHTLREVVAPEIQAAADMLQKLSDAQSLHDPDDPADDAVSVAVPERNQKTILEESGAKIIDLQSRRSRAV